MIQIDGLTFYYPTAQAATLQNLCIQIPAGARCLLLGRNGAGKSTLLRILGGKHMVTEQSARIFDRSAFHDTSLANEVAYVGGNFEVKVDVYVHEMLARRQPLDDARLKMLLQILDVNPNWRMHQLSDGQRRRVQLLLVLIHPKQVLLLDEVTKDLDLIGRADFISFLKQESEQHGVAILFATHILDRLDEWATHLLHIEQGRIQRFGQVSEIGDLSALKAQNHPYPLFELVDRWFRQTV